MLILLISPVMISVIEKEAACSQQVRNVGGEVLLTTTENCIQLLIHR